MISGEIPFPPTDDGFQATASGAFPPAPHESAWPAPADPSERVPALAQETPTQPLQLPTASQPATRLAPTAEAPAWPGAEPAPIAGSAPKPAKPAEELGWPASATGSLTEELPTPPAAEARPAQGPTPAGIGAAVVKARRARRVGMQRPASKPVAERPEEKTVPIERLDLNTIIHQVTAAAERARRAAADALAESSQQKEVDQEHIAEIRKVAAALYDRAIAEKWPLEEVGTDIRAVSPEENARRAAAQKQTAIGKGRTSAGKWVRGIVHSAGFGEDIQPVSREVVKAYGWKIGDRFEVEELPQAPEQSETPAPQPASNTKGRGKKAAESKQPEEPREPREFMYDLVLNTDGSLVERQQGKPGANAAPPLEAYDRKNIATHLRQLFVRMQKNAE